MVSLVRTCPIEKTVRKWQIKMNTGILTKWQNIRTGFSNPLQSKEPLFTLRLHREIAAQGTKLRDESYLASGGNQIHMKQRSPTNQTWTLVLRVPFQTMYCQFGRILTLLWGFEHCIPYLFVVTCSTVLDCFFQFT